MLAELVAQAEFRTVGHRPKAKNFAALRPSAVPIEVRPRSIG